MKLHILLLASLLSSPVFAQNYICKDNSGNEAELIIINSTQIKWSEPWHSATSKGRYVGTDKAPYSPYKNFSLFQLTDFYVTSDSSYILAMSEDKKQVVVYFDNDDHTEEETSYSCQINRF